MNNYNFHTNYAPYLKIILTAVPHTTTGDVVLHLQSIEERKSSMVCSDAVRGE